MTRYSSYNVACQQVAMTISIDQIKKLREETGAPVMEVKKALEEAEKDEKKAKQLLRKVGFERAAKKTERETGAGAIFTYVHHSGTVASMVELLCQTDFVARTDEFKNLGKEVAMQVASMNPKDVDQLMAQEYIREPEKKVEELVKEVVAKTGENIQIGRIARFAIGE